MPYDKSVDFSDQAATVLEENINYASPIGFRLLIDSQRYPNTQFSVQSASIPELSVPTSVFSTPQAEMNVPGDKIEYGDFSCKFIIDEELANYQEMHDWLIGLVKEQDSKQIDKFRDMTLLILNSHNNVAREIQFSNAFPVSLSTLEFDASATSVEYLTATITFKYSYFRIL